MTRGNDSEGGKRPDSADSRLWTVDDVAEYLRIPKATLYQWRYLGIGPKAGRVGRHVRYDPEEVRQWFRRQVAA